MNYVSGAKDLELASLNRDLRRLNNPKKMTSKRASTKNKASTSKKKV